MAKRRAEAPLDRPGAIARRSRAHEANLADRFSTEGLTIAPGHAADSTWRVEHDLDPLPEMLALDCLQIPRWPPRLANPFMPRAKAVFSVDEVARELAKSLSTNEDRAITALRLAVFRAYDDAVRDVVALRADLTARAELKNSLAYIDDQIALLSRWRYDRVFSGLANWIKAADGLPQIWQIANPLLSLDLLKAARAHIASLAKQPRGPHGKPFQIALIRRLAEVWASVTGKRPPVTLKEASSRRGTGHLFFRLVAAVFKDLGISQQGVTKSARTIRSALGANGDANCSSQ